jgi:hypothetical protein
MEPLVSEITSCSRFRYRKLDLARDNASLAILTP